MKNANNPSQPADSPGAVRLAASILVAAVAVAYCNSLHGSFVYDDNTAILGNASIRHLWPLQDLLLPPRGLTVSGRPVANLLFALNYAVSGTQVWSYHLLNVLIHAGAALALFGVVRRTLLGPVLMPRFGRDSLPIAAIIAALWALHPIQTEAVTYVVQRVESLMGLFFLLTLYGLVRTADSPNALRWRVLATTACVLGAGSKEVIVCVPVLALLHDRTFFAGSFAEAWRRRRPLCIALFATWLPLAAFVASTGWNRGGSAGFGSGTHPVAYWLTQFQAVFTYLRLALWPSNLTFEYGTFWATPAQALPYACVVVPLAVATLVALRTHPVWGYLGCWFFIILSPTSVVPGTYQMIVEHRMYLSLAAVAAAVAGSAYAWAGRRSLVAGGAAAALLAGLTLYRNSQYDSEVSLWADTLKKAPGNDRAQNNYGTALENAGRIPEAIAAYRAAIKITPLYPEARNNLCNLLTRVGQVDEAIRQGQAAILLQPTYENAHNNLGNALLAAGRFDDALREYRRATTLVPNDIQPLENTGLALLGIGHLDEGIKWLQRAVEINPSNPQSLYDLGNALLQAGRTNEAIDCYRRSLRLNPTDTNVLNNLGNALLSQGNIREAMMRFSQAIQSNPVDPLGYNNLGAALTRIGRMAEAAGEFEAALRIRPDYADARRNLDWVNQVTARQAAAH